MTGRLIDADAFEASIRERYCRSCDDLSGMRCKACWVDDMLGEIDLAPEVEVEQYKMKVHGYIRDAVRASKKKSRTWKGKV